MTSLAIKSNPKTPGKENMKTLKIITAVATLFLAACADPIDSVLVTDQGPEAYQASIKEFFEKGDPEAVEAFNFYAQHLTIENLNNSPEIRTPRDLIVQASEQVLADLTPAERQRITDANENYEKLQKGLYTSEASLEIKKEFFGLMPYVKAVYVNDSGLSLSESAWTAEVYINDQAEPSATYTYTTSYGTGFDSGYTMTGTRLMGHVKGDPNWITPAIQRAEKTVVKVTPVLGTQKGLDLKYLTGSKEQLDRLNSREDLAKKWIEKFKS